ncbi:DUF3348 domain-containing protein [Bordetella bronchialis]|uniref:DUF3348 domain-containing protein n=1 Tax=Bordetella bronchialis TaxID=463025 RepID=A0A193FYQ2_9BORD|nr:DUF3348 domain-containing protein [Bordetella bronchialis]ANN72119.1 hypothetical protein BAU08_12920 [Bordetella bronchialis]
MEQVPRRTSLSGPTLVRLLGRLTDIEVSEPRQSLADRLSLWLGWTDAIALSAVLNSNPPAAAAGAATETDEARECDRVRATLAKAIAEKNRASAPGAGQGWARPGGPAPAKAPVDYVIYRQRYLSLQQTMETAIGNLRARLRGLMAGRTPAMTQLAAVDAIMEKALGAREHNTLAAVPGLLETHFHRLRRAEAAALAEAENGTAASAVKPGAWLDAFRQDMRAMLLAELDIRFQPVEGLLAALRAR